MKKRRGSQLDSVDHQARWSGDKAVPVEGTSRLEVLWLSTVVSHVGKPMGLSFF